MVQCKPSRTPHWIIHIEDGVHKIECKPLTPSEHASYRSLIGEILYLSIFTRPDLAYIVGVLARHQTSPQTHHLIASRHILRYLRGTKGMSLRLGNVTQNPMLILEVYADASWADEKDDRKSTSGYIAMLNGSPLSWASKKQSKVALSSTEAELYALVEAVKESIYYRNWFKFYMHKSIPPIPIYILEDNQGAIAIAKHTEKERLWVSPLDAQRDNVSV